MQNSFFKMVKFRFYNPVARKAVAFQFAYWFLAVLYLETILHAVAFNGFSGKFLYVMGFSIAAACLLALAISFVPRKGNFAVTLAVSIIVTVFYGSQLVYNLIFGTLYSVSQTQMGGAAISTFWRETLQTMWNNLYLLLLLLIPLIALVIVRKFCRGFFAGATAVQRSFLIAGALIVHFVVVQCLTIGGTGIFTDYYFYHAKDATTNQTAERFGLVTAFRLELTSRGKGNTSADDEQLFYDIVETQPVVEETLPVEDETIPTEVTEPITYNVMDIDFDALNGMTTDETVLAINNYISKQTGTVKNQYTGMLKDYNLIVLCAESFATGAIHPELTPTLYRLVNEGIIFNNFYNSFPNNTTDGEYSMCTGLYPDGSRDKVGSSFYATRNSYMPFTLGMAFKEQAGVQSYGYHSNLGSYYARNVTHPNIGYQMKFKEAGMKFTTGQPSSDMEMIEQTIDDYIGQDQFHAYYMTYSGHFIYDYQRNPMVARNYDRVREYKEYSYETRCYLACNIELDKALAYLLERLEEEGIADRTAIVLAGDHFPYGLYDRFYSELVGYPIDDFSKYHSSLIFWVGGLEENIVVDEYCCNVDILPTILNLWGFDYDSRMLAGTDVFSDGPHIAIRVDKSFYTDKVWFNANTGEIKYLVDESEIPEGYVDNMIKLVMTKMNLSTNILNTAYYNYVFEKGDVTVDRGTWTDWDTFNGVPKGN